MTTEEMIKNRAKEYAYKNYEQGGDSDTWEDIFVDGAKWMYEEFEKNRLFACENMTDEEGEREEKFCMNFMQKNHRIPTISDTIEITRKEMIDKACEWLKSVMLEDDIYGVGNNIENLKELINDFRKAMEGGEE